MAKKEAPLPTQSTKTSFEMVDIARIDDPERAMRTDLSHDSVRDLAASIKQIGIVEPLVLQPKGDRFEVIAGHRRLTASGYAGVGRVPAYIVDGTREQLEMMKIHENLYRVDVPPLDEAKHYERIIQDMKLSPAKIARLINRSERYVKDRLKLLKMAEPLRIALQEGHITMTVALELSRIENPVKLADMLFYVKDSAISSDTAKKWVDEQLTGVNEGVEVQPRADAPTDSGPVPEHHEECFFCFNPVSFRDGRTVWVHDECIVVRNDMDKQEEPEG